MTLCKCGCGQSTSIAKQTSKKKGHIKGVPVDYIIGHHSKTHGNSRPSIYAPNHSSAEKDGRVWLHIAKAESALGHELPHGAEVHHVDGNPLNNENSNLVICQDRAYHKLIHKRTAAYRACGHASWLKCSFCKKYDDPANLYLSPNQAMHIHRECSRKYEQEKRRSCHE